jgi:putative flavoprotein involved in K+ transport
MHDSVPSRIDTVVIGAGQSGLATSRRLQQRDVDHVVLDRHPRIGDAWRRRWDSLKLFTPARFDGLPGMPFPGPAGSYPTKDEMADYLEGYAAAFELPVLTGVEVGGVGRAGHRFTVSAADGSVDAANVVVATGAYHRPRVPGFADELGDAVFQLHSSEYRRPSQIPDGAVLVVGAGNSGAEIALELSERHRVWLSGPDTGQEPTAAGSAADRLFVPIMWFLASRVFRITNPIGRKVRDHFLDPPRGIPLGRVRRKDLVEAGIQRVPRTTGTKDGSPLLEDGRVLEASSVVWCTGFVPGFDWIDIPVFDHRGFPVQHRGVVDSVPGLFFMGLPFQYSLSSALVGGVGRDADYVAGIIESRT